MLQDISTWKHILVPHTCTHREALVFCILWIMYNNTANTGTVYACELGVGMGGVDKYHTMVFVYVMVWVAIVFGINSASNAGMKIVIV